MTHYVGTRYDFMDAPNGERGDSWYFNDGTVEPPGPYWQRETADGWWLDERKDEDPRHQWVRKDRIDCDRCGTSVYDRAVLGKSEIYCDGERRNVDRWIPGEPLQQEDWR
jgi:hypothetical protein